MLVLIAAHAVLAAALPLLERWYGRGVWALATSVPLATLVWAIVQMPNVLDDQVVSEQLTWAPQLELNIDLRLDSLALLMTCIVSGVGTLVLAFCARYTQRGHGRESALLVAFAGAMIGLVTADNLLVLYVFWELTTVVSFLLIAGRGRTTEHRRAAEQALITTAAGGLAMLLGFVLLGETGGTYSISELLANPPDGGYVTIAVVLVLLGAFTKAAQMPLHAWLPGAMVAPTPVSAFLHAAAMVKAGVYLVARFAPGFAHVPPWQALVLIVGSISLVVGAWQALQEHDLKRVLAYGTISELGLLIILLGHGSRTAAIAGETMLLAHATFKSALFLVTGTIERLTGTRDMRKLSGLGRRQPWLLTVAVIAAASMSGVPPLVGFIGHEGAFEAFLHPSGLEGAYHMWVLAALFVGAVLTVAYSLRYLWGAFADRPGVKPVTATRREPWLVGPITVLAVISVALGVAFPLTDALVEPYANQLRSGGVHYDLSLWHGFTTVFVLSVLALILGVLLFRANRVLRRQRLRLPGIPTAQEVYWRTMDGLMAGSVRLTRHTQVGSLPVYLTVLLATVLVLPGGALLYAATKGDVPLSMPPLWDTGIELPLGAVVLTCSAALVGTRHRLTAVLLVGAVGYGVAGLFLLHGAPDLALAQFLIETLTLIIIVLVLRGLPADLGPRHTPPRTVMLRAVLACTAGAFIGLLSLVISSARQDPSVAEAMVRRVAETGSHNVVNAIIVDFRAADTFGEISVLLVAAIGAASLLGYHRPASRVEPGRPSVAMPEHRPSLLLEVVVRLLFPCVLVLSVYLLFSGHLRPGGGFAGGLVAALAFALRYLMGGRDDKSFAGPLDPRVVAGSGLAVAGTAGLIPLLFGGPPLGAAVVDWHLPVFGQVEFATSLVFDVGVYLVVAGVGMLLVSAAGPAQEPGGGKGTGNGGGPPHHTAKATKQDARRYNRVDDDPDSGQRPTRQRDSSTDQTTGSGSR